jgi:NAD-dependent dihydropyrimidine dehydrogenase PreA subunit
MAYRINAQKCTACGECEQVCPVSCITDSGNGIRIIDEDACISCGSCAAQCPVQCISET